MPGRPTERGPLRITPCSHSAPRRASRLRCSATRSSRETFRFASFIRSPGRARILEYKKRARRVGTRANCSLRSQLRLHKYVMRHAGAGGNGLGRSINIPTNAPVLKASGDGRLNRTASVNYPRASALAAVPFPGYYTRAGQFLSQAVTVTSPVRPATSHN